MKRFFTWALAAVLTAGIVYQAWARMEPKQKDDGTAVWDHSTRNQNFEYPVGQFHLSVFLADVTIPVTRYITVPVTNMRVSQIYGTQEGDIDTANEYIRFWHFDSVGNLSGEITNGISQMNFKTQATTGTTLSFTPTSTGANNFFTQAHVIAISSLGSSVGNVPASFVITLVPR